MYKNTEIYENHKAITQKCAKTYLFISSFRQVLTIIYNFQFSPEFISGFN